MSGTTEERPTESDLIKTLTDTNSALEKAIEERDYEVIQGIVDKRGPMVHALMQHHENTPIDPSITKNILEQEQRIQKKMKAMQAELGDALETSQKHAHAQRMYNKFNTNKDPFLGG